jgi:hypothetical protein
MDVRDQLPRHKAIWNFSWPFTSLCGLVVRVPDYWARGLGFDSRSYQIFRELVGLERGLLSLVGTTEELLGRKRSGYGLEIQDYCRRDTRSPLYKQTLALISPTSGGHSVGIVSSRTEATKFVFHLHHEVQNALGCTLTLSFFLKLQSLPR